MACSLFLQSGACVADPTIAQLESALRDLDPSDVEHPDASLARDDGWSLTAFASGLLVWENCERADVAARHMAAVPTTVVLMLWRCLMRDEVDKIDAESWQPGYGPAAG